NEDEPPSSGPAIFSRLAAPFHAVSYGLAIRAAAVLLIAGVILLVTLIRLHPAHEAEYNKAEAITAHDNAAIVEPGGGDRPANSKPIGGHATDNLTPIPV